MNSSASSELVLHGETHLSKDVSCPRSLKTVSPLIIHGLCACGCVFLRVRVGLGVILPLQEDWGGDKGRGRGHS